MSGYSPSTLSLFAAPPSQLPPINTNTTNNTTIDQPIDVAASATDPQPTFMEKAKTFYSKLQKPKNLPAPKYGDFNSEAKSVFVSANEMGDGVNIQKARVVSASSYHEFSVAHGISLASMMKPADYTLTLTHGSTSGLLYGQYSSTGVLVANLKQKIVRGMQTELLYIVCVVVSIDFYIYWCLCVFCATRKAFTFRCCCCCDCS